MAHWSEQKERGGGYFQLQFMLWLYRRMGIRRLRLLVHPVVMGIWFFSPAARRVSRHFLGLVAERLQQTAPTIGDVYRHFYSFTCALLEKVAAWSGDINLSDIALKTSGVQDLIGGLQRREGAVLICSHLGNIEMLRALGHLQVAQGQGIPNLAINSIVEFGGTAHFNKMLAKANPQAMLRLVPAGDMGADTIIMLKDRLNAGELVAIAADRTAAGNRGRTERISFLGQPGYFPQGAFVLASLLEAPIYYMFGIRNDDADPASNYGFYVWKAGVDLRGSRRERMAKIRILMQDYVGHLEGLCTQHPYQWYNFFNFWKNPAIAANGSGDA